MFYADHAPPHFHVTYGDFKAVVDIQRLEIIRGSLPRRALNLVLDWAELHQQDLMEDWSLCIKHQVPNPIKPLE